VPSTLLVTNDFGPRAGGIETFIIGLLERAPRGEVVVYTSHQDNSADYDREWLENYGVEVIRDKARILLPTPRVIRAIRSIIKSRGLHRVWFGAAAPLGFAARFIRSAGVTHMVALTHGHEAWWAKVPLFSLAMREIGKNIDAFGYLGNYTRDEISRAVPERKLTKIAPGIDTSHFRPSDSAALREKFGLGSRPTIVSVGRLVHRKGQDRLIDALPLIQKRFPDVALLFIGEGPHRKVLDALVKKYSLHDDVFFIGRINYRDLPAFISMGDIFAMPSRNRLFGMEVEGLGIVYLEASSCGLPVIAGNSGGAPDAVIEGETGFVVNGRDVGEIAEKAITLLSDAALRERMGVRGRSWVEAEWRWELWSTRFNTLLEHR